MTETLVMAEFRDFCLPGKQCPFCAMRAKATARYLRSFLHEYVNDSDMNARLWRSFGFCRDHASLFKNQPWTGERDALGVALVYERILHVWQEALERAAPEGGAGQAVRSHFAQRLLHPREAAGLLAADMLEPAETCPACVQVEESDTFALAEIASALERNPEGMPWKWLEQSFGLCLPHLRGLLRPMREEAAVRHLCVLQSRRLDALRGHLNEYVRKHDYRFQSETYSDAERTSWEDAVSLAVGTEMAAILP
jgi:hypothetical protein